MTDPAKLLDVPAVLAPTRRPRSAHGEEGAARLIATELLTAPPHERDDALDDLMVRIRAAYDNAFADWPAEERERACERFRRLIMREFAHIGVQWQHEQGHA